MEFDNLFNGFINFSSKFVFNRGRGERLGALRKATESHEAHAEFTEVELGLLHLFVKFKTIS